MSRPDTLFEAVSYDLKQFRERRIADRRAVPRAGMDRRTGEKGRTSAANDAPVLMHPPVVE